MRTSLQFNDGPLFAVLVVGLIEGASGLLAGFLQIFVQFAAGFSRVGFGFVKRLTRIMPQLFGGLVRLFTSAILVIPGAGKHGKCG